MEVGIAGTVCLQKGNVEYTEGVRAISDKLEDKVVCLGDVGN